MRHLPHVTVKSNETTINCLACSYTTGRYAKGKQAWAAFRAHVRAQMESYPPPEPVPDNREPMF